MRRLFVFGIAGVLMAAANGCGTDKVSCIQTGTCSGLPDGGAFQDGDAGPDGGANTDGGKSHGMKPDAQAPMGDAQVQAMTDGGTGMDANIDSDGSTNPDAGSDAATTDAGSDSGSAGLIAPTPGFTLSGSGNAPVTVTATSTATPGDSAIVEIRYQWDDGTGTSTTNTHGYQSGGTYHVEQWVRDAAGHTVYATQTITIGGFTPVRMNPADVTLVEDQAETGAMEPNIGLSRDRMDIEAFGIDPAAVRSDQSVAPSSGVYYFEAERLVSSTGVWGFGVASATHVLSAGLDTDAQSFGTFTQGTVSTSNTPCRGVTGPMYVDAATTHFGFVVDYSGTTPVVHLIAKHNGVVGVQCTVDMTSVTTPLYMLYSGPRAEVGYQARFNSGADTTNHPFFYTLTQLQNLLNGIGETTAASSLVLGFGKTRALAQDTAPSLTVPANTSVSLGSPLTLMATATDAEEGALTDKIEWLDQASLHYAPVVGFGGTFKLTPSALGKHDVLVSVTDKLGVTTRQIVTVTVTGTLPQAGTVQLVKDGLSGQGAFVASDGVSAYFTSVPHHFKDGLRANQGVYGQFWYFEAHRNVSSKGFGIGLVVGDGSLDPYEFVKVPWSMSINTSASVWHNLISVGNYDTSFADYGFAVDYRGDSPIVYVIVNGQLAKKLAMPEVTVPLYPMAYGGRTDFGSAGAPAVTFDFSPPFQFDPATILGADGVGVELGWGDVNTP